MHITLRYHVTIHTATTSSFERQYIRSKEKDVAKILIVEDDQDLNYAYRMILQKEKHEVVSAHNGDDALEKLQDFTPDLILLDLLMPVKSGVEFLKEYDVVRNHHGVKVLIFTNLEHASEIHEAFRLGADQCVIKAWTAPSGLIKVVNDILAANSSGSTLANR